MSRERPGFMWLRYSTDRVTRDDEPELNEAVNTKGT